MFVEIIMEFSIDFLSGTYSSVKYRCRGFNYGARTVMLCVLKFI